MVHTSLFERIKIVSLFSQLELGCMAKRFGEEYDDAIFVDECTLGLKVYNPTNWRKDDQPLLRAAGGKLGRPKHGFKVHLFGGISRKGITPPTAFSGMH